MDDQVIAAMARWPNVPAVHGWLRLDRRGRWMLIDRGLPGFDEQIHGEGSSITSPPIIDFIGRNYAHDASGRWYWQNGPQRVFVDIDLAPLLLRVMGEAPTQTLVTHTGYLVSRIERVLADPDGNLLVITDLGPGAIDDRDLGSLDLEMWADSEDDHRSADNHTGAVLGTTALGRLRLMGGHDVLCTGPHPATELGFVQRPR